MRLSIADATCLQNWLASQATVTEVLNLHSVGLVENLRFTDRARNEFMRLWSWSAPRFGGAAGRAQEAFYERHGSQALWRRYTRVQALCKAYAAGRIRVIHPKKTTALASQG